MMMVFRMAKVYLVRGIPAFLMYCVYGVPRLSLLLDSTDYDIGYGMGLDIMNFHTLC